jgi:2,3-bisphosphoglycerate-independent phosphoglycerate mutase
MKYVIILPDGASDEPLPQLGGKTPLEAAHIPHMDSVAQRGCVGRVVTIPEGFEAGTDVGTLVLLGFDPHQYHTGRAPMEALARHLHASSDQLIFRCNFVTLADGKMKDFTAGHISAADANELIAALNAATFPGEVCAFHTGISYRNLAVLTGASHIKLVSQPPHDITDQPVDGYWPRGEGQERVRSIMRHAAEVLADHPVNVRRKARGENQATNIWLWGQGKPMMLETLESRFGLKGAVITAVDIIRGLALGMGMDLIEVAGATGYIDTDYEAKGRAAVEALDRYDVVFVHVEAPDEAAHEGRAEEKKKALERIDEAIVGPILGKCRTLGEYRILIAPDHATLVRTKGHHAEPPPFCCAGTGIGGSGRRFNEREAMASGFLLDPGHTLLERFLKEKEVAMPDHS